MPTSTGPLPPSVEKAYYRKCIDLRRRINEVESHNDETRLRLKRLQRAILKMRLERAFLLEQLQQRMEYNVDGSDKSTSPPPTPQEKPLRSKRSHRQKTPQDHQRAAALPSSTHGGHAPSSPPAGASDTRGAAHAASSAQSSPEPSNRNPFPFPHSPNGHSTTGRPAAFLPGRADFYADDERRSTSTARENGGEDVRTYGAGETGEALSAGPSIRTDANGDRRIVSGDLEMANADDAADLRETGALGGGFTAVNR